MSLTGKLEDLALADIFQILSIGKKTGALLISSTNLKAAILFKRGLVVRAECDSLDTKDLGQDLLKAGIIKKTSLDMAYQVKEKLEDRSISEILLEMGAVTKDTLDRVARKRIERVIVRLLMLKEGDFRFEPDTTDFRAEELPDTGWEISKGLSPEYLLMEGARIYDETMHYGAILEDEDLSEGSHDELTSLQAQTSDISALRALSQELRFPETLSEVSLLIMRYASDLFKRGILFEHREGKLYGLGQFGLDLEGADEIIRNTVVEPVNDDALSRVIRSKTPFKGELKRDDSTERIISLIGGGWPVEVAIFPIVVEEDVKALLYCDNQPDGESIGETPGLEIFINQAGLALEKALLKKRLKEREAH
ncbi:MAG: DUF4388 domain-containing protein [Nitrospirae bacterium]|nr:MAG: DUF4388 domain-containing protein [Nitrospirota bacterium]